MNLQVSEDGLRAASDANPCRAAQLRPSRRLRDNVLDKSLRARHARASLVGDSNYYIGYFSALQILSLTTQPALTEQIVVNKQIKPSTLKIKNIPFQFIYHNEEHFFGQKKTWIDSYNKVIASDLEKTLIDCLFKPHYAGGITEITKAIYKSKDKIDFDEYHLKIFKDVKMQIEGKLIFEP